MNWRKATVWFFLGVWALLGGRISEGVAPALPVSNIADPTLRRLLEGVEDRYNRLKSARLRFEQLYRQGSQLVREESGTLYLRKPGQMRWEYESPEVKLFLSDGKRLILYVPSENRATEMPVKESGDLRTPLRFLLGRLEFEKEFEHIAQETTWPALEEGNLLVRAVPKRMAEHLDWVIFELSPQYEIRRVIVTEPGAIQTEFRFRDEQADLPLAPQLFRFQAPPGTELIQE